MDDLLKGIDLSNVRQIHTSTLGDSDKDFMRNLVTLSTKTPPCECHDCQLGWYDTQEQQNPPYLYRREISIQDATTIASSYIIQIRNDKTYLEKHLKSHADVLMSRWRKRSQDKRATLVREVAPNLPEELFPLTTYAWLEDTSEYRSYRARRQLLLPWLSIQKLKTNPAALFALLHYRTFYPPQDWAAFASNQHTAGWAQAWFNLEYSPTCVVMHGCRYGEVVGWEADQAHRGDILGFLRARLMLEAQALLMDTLRKIVDKILDGVDNSGPPRSEKWRAQIAAGFKRTDEVELWSPYTNAALSKPPTFDVDYLVSLAKTRADALRDHLLDLQMELKYLRGYIKNVSETRTFKALNEERQEHLLGSYIYADVHSYLWWHWVEIECCHVRQLYVKYRDSIHPGLPLPSEYEMALGALELLLVNQCIFRVESMRSVLLSAPGFKENWDVEEVSGNPRGTFRARRRGTTNFKQMLMDDPLEWCLMQMDQEPDKQGKLDHAFLFAFLEEHLSKSSKQERARIDELLMQKLSDLSASHEALVCVRLHRPRNKARSLEDCFASEGRPGWTRFGAGRMKPSHQDVQQAGSLLLKRFYRSKASSGLCSLAWFKQRRVFRAIVTKFWESMRDIIDQDLRSAKLSKNHIFELLQLFDATNTVGYKSLTAKEEEEEESRARAQKEKILLSNSFQGFTMSTTETTSPWTPSNTREKPKTRPDKAVELANVQKVPVEHQEHLAPPDPIYVPKRALAVFDLMFSNTEDNTAKGVMWQEYVHALCDAGFRAMSNGGSAVRFEKSTSGAIVFHKPHPEPKIDSIMLRSMGRRMAKRFGWSRERFCEKESKVDVMRRALDRPCG